MKLYHATFSAYLPSILQHGLGAVQNKNWEFNVDGAVCLAEDPEIAVSFCECAEETPSEVYNSGICCLEIDADTMDQTLLSQDANLTTPND